MKFTIFHHDDLDGYMTAVLSRLLFCPDKVTRFEQLSYGMDMDGLIQDASESSCVLTVDLPPHISAVVSVDHHRSAEDLVDSLRLLGEGPEVYFNSRARSASEVLLDAWPRELQGLKPVIDEVSLVDSAGYLSLDEACQPRPSLQFAYALDNLSPDERDEALNRVSLELRTNRGLGGSPAFWPRLLAIQTPDISRAMLELSEQYLDDLQRRYDLSSRHAQLYRGWVLLSSQEESCFHRFGVYRLFDRCHGFVVATPSPSGGFQVSLGLNSFWPENPALKTLNLAQAASRRPGGGGHRRASGFETSRLQTVKDLELIVDNELVVA